MERTAVPVEKTRVLITGCSSGIGLGLAARLAADAARRFKGKGVTLWVGVPALQVQHGHALSTVFATMRDLAKGERLLQRLGGRSPDTLELLQLDVTDPHSLAAAVRCLQGQHLDVLVCNAGVGLMAPLEMCSDQAMRAVFDVNVFGTARTIQAFLPAMKRRRAGRILVSSSVGGLQGLPFNAVYCASKFALEGLCESLAIVLQPFNVHVTLVECGPVRTDFMDNARRADPDGPELRALDAETQRLYRRYLRHLARLLPHSAQRVDEVLQVFVDAIAAPVPPLRCVAARIPAPLSRLRPGGPDGTDYVRAMHDFVFGPGEAAEEQP